MVLGDLKYNPGLYSSLGPGFEEEEPDTASGFWDWWKRNGDSATGILDSGLCMINPKRAGCPGARPNYPESGGNYGRSSDQTLLYVIAGIVLIMLFILILKK